MITNLSGAKITGFKFEYDYETEVYKSCSVIWQNENYVFGGENQKRQIAKIDGCRLRRIGELAFDLMAAGCVNVNNQKILLCFNLDFDLSSDDFDKCRSLPSPTGSYQDVQRSKYAHQLTKIASSDSRFF